MLELQSGDGYQSPPAVLMGIWVKRFPLHFSKSRFSRSELSQIVSEFIALNRQRLQGSRPLSVSDLERMQQIRADLEMEFEGIDPTTALQSASRTKRRTLRVPAQLDAQIQAGGHKIAGSVLDLSDSGAFLHFDQHLEPGTPLLLHIEKSVRGAGVSVQGVVAWTRDEQNSELPRGVGVRFQNLDIDQQLALTSIVENMLTSI